MSAAIYLRQHDAAYMLVDAASYRRDGIVVSFGDKCIAIPELHCAFTTFGPANWAVALEVGCRSRFCSFDDLLAGIEDFARLTFEQFESTITVNPSTTCELWMMGWSAARGHVEAFQLAMCNNAEWEKWKAEAPGLETSRQPFRCEPFTVHVASNPCPTTREILDADLPSIGVADNIDPETDLLHLMEIQRRVLFEGDHYCVGGYALLTRVDAHGVTQRRIHEWTEDKVGELITPKPIDWSRWRAARLAEQAISAAPAGMSKLKRDMLARKAAKGRLKVVA
jgi:hypothetical protein